MKKTLIALLLLTLGAVLLAGCGGIKEGHVTAKDFIPAHEEDYMRQQYAGQDCSSYTDASGNQQRSCSDRYISVPDTRHVSDKWTLTIEACTDKDGKKDCKHNTLDVSHSTYEDAHDGDLYNGESRKLTRQ